MNIFIAFANQDRDVRDKLLRQMNLVKDRQGWDIWTAKEIKAGERWDDEIKQRLMDSEVVILLLSTDFFNSKYIIETELPNVIEKHKAGDCQIIPVIARVCHWKDTTFGEYAQLGEIQALPVGEKPIVSNRHWDNEDEPYFEVVQAVKDSVREFQAKKKEKAESVERERLVLEKKRQEEERLRQAIANEKIEAERRKEIALEKQKQEEILIRQAEAVAIKEIKQSKKEKRQREKTQRQQEANLAEIKANRQREVESLREQKEQEHQELERNKILIENAEWYKAVNVHNVESYEGYLTKYPRGNKVDEARKRVKELKNQASNILPLKNTSRINWGKFIAGAGMTLALIVLFWPLTNMLFETAKSRQNAQVSMGNLMSNERLTDSSIKNVDHLSEDTIPFINYPIVKIEGGSFQMGSPQNEKGRYSDECQHLEYVRSFSIGKYEVTQRQWRVIMGDNPSYHKGCENCPVEMVSWKMVLLFIKKLNEKTGKNYRLPTEKEWEYAARGGKGFIFSGSDTSNDVAWNTENADSITQQIASKLRNPFGMYDMSGNVFEWCENTYKPYLDCRGDSGVYRVCRGGSCFHAIAFSRVALRHAYSQNIPRKFIGFRLAHD